MPATSLVLGYKQVESFGPDEDYLDEEEEEVSYVTLDLGVVEPTLLPSTSTYRLIGLDTPTPFLQLSGSIFKGRHDTLLGTELLFTEEKNDNKRSLAHVGSTEQRIRFKEVQLKDKVRAEPTPSERKEADLQEEVASMYVDVDTDKITAQATSAGELEQSRRQGTTEPAPARKRKAKSKKGKERAVDVIEEDAMDTT